ncbi:hypothetical protein PEX1_105910 [Penicillium expansum]|uniref:Zn(2)-C6 fungal-type domain-containing protein n=1 Tax=Penicillium expansum TaxID=27334 RepID=A0A0A2IAJ2_PENEN|nr:hypothetical protein PEX2_058100 [Penicillium expansum]KGO40069.1 hypothetical protein PEXP_034530 [Penicillium expansum]KGO53167.1 hypothetical protein PEX2_058100 [Penicillium expansum]KGO73318.1 hypothetical protein PEX1_105910 [Penicillium expansum]
MPPVSKTCQGCADSKVRCVRDTDIACNRCLRLGKECQYRRTGRRFKGFHKDRKIAALELKINELKADRGGLEGNDTNTSTRSTSSIDGDAPLEDIISRDFLDTETAERYLTIFKTKLTPHFPFVVVSLDVSVQQLRKEKPFLCLAILASASYENMPLQRALGNEVKKVVASRMVIGGEISFELLQGLLVFLAWSHYHSRPHRYTQFLQLAIGLMIDLRLDRPPQTRTWKTELRFGLQYNLQNQTFNRASWGSNEQRAVLGCYYLSSSIAMLVQKKSTILRLPYQEECCKALHEANEYPHDKYISYVIQLQFIAEKVDNLSAKHGIDLETPGSGSELYIANLKSDLEAFYRHLPFDINESFLLAIQYHATGLCLYQLALNITNQESQSPFDSNSWRDEMAFSAFISANSILNLYIQLPSNDEVGFNNTQWVQIAFALLVAYRHTVAAYKPDQAAAFLETLSKLRSRVGALSTSDVDMNGARDAFFDFGNRIARIENWLGEHGRQEDNSQSDESFDEYRYTLCLEPTNFDGLIGAAEHLDVPFGNEFSSSADDLQIPQDSFFASSFEQIMGEWV